MALKYKHLNYTENHSALTDGVIKSNEKVLNLVTAIIMDK